jgi:copper chaperone CopZ
MKKSLKKIMIVAFALLSNIFYAQIKNNKTEAVKIYGNCGMCEKTIEKAGNLKNIASVDWDKDSKMATLNFDAKKTNQNEILKKIALAGYDSDSFLAPDEAYKSLPNCCQYNRVKKEVATEETKMEMKHEDIKTPSNQESKPLTTVFNTYFDLKNALVASDPKGATKKGTELLTAIEKVDMGKLEMDVHMVWMKVVKPLKESARLIASSNKIEEQRNLFSSFSEDIYKLIKTTKAATPIYFQHCPMANNGKGGNWLSQESEIKNPYYGSKMLSCGKTVETIK